MGHGKNPLLISVKLRRPDCILGLRFLRAPIQACWQAPSLLPANAVSVDLRHQRPD